MKTIWSIPIILSILIILSFSVIAAETKKTKTYDEDEKKIRIYDKNSISLADYILIDNSCDSNFRFCSAVVEVDLKKGAKLFDSLDFYRIIGINFIDGKVRWHKTFYHTLGDKIDVIDYNLTTGEEIGTHKEDAPEWTQYRGEIFTGKETFKIEAEKRPGWIMDWVVTVLDDVALDVWAIWGNMSTGDEAEIILLNPLNNSIQTSSSQIFNCSAEINQSVGATLTNISLEFWNGTAFEIKQTDISLPQFNNGSNDTTHDPDSLTNPENAFDEDDGTYAHHIGSGTLAKELGKTFNPRFVQNFTYNATGYINSGGGNSGTMYIYIQTYDGGTWNTVDTYSQAFSWGGEGGTALFKAINTTVINDTVQGLRIAMTTPGGDGIYTLRWFTEEYYDNSATSSTQSFSQAITEDILWTCSAGDSDGVVGYASVNHTILLNTPPQITINKPSTSEATNNITFNFTFTDDLNNSEYCYYNVTTSGLGVVVATNEINCSNPIEYQTISDGVGYILNIWANDTIGNSNSSSRVFNVDTAVVGGGGGGGASPLALILSSRASSCDIYREPFNAELQNFQDTTNAENFISNLIKLWDAFWDVSLCDSAGSIVPIR